MPLAVCYRDAETPRVKDIISSFSDKTPIYISFRGFDVEQNKCSMISKDYESPKDVSTKLLNRTVIRCKILEGCYGPGVLILV